MDKLFHLTRRLICTHINNMRNKEGAVWEPQYSPGLSYRPRPIGLHSVYWSRGVLCPEYCLWCVFYLYYPTILIFMQFQCNSFHILTREKYCNRNTPNPRQIIQLIICHYRDEHKPCKILDKWEKGAVLVLNKVQLSCLAGTWSYILNYKLASPQLQ